MIPTEDDKIERVKLVICGLNYKHQVTTPNAIKGHQEVSLVFVRDKIPTEIRSNLVYGKKCGNRECNRTSVGETKQSQHKKPIQAHTRTISAI